jgi:hypothetical protein
VNKGALRNITDKASNENRGIMQFNIDRILEDAESDDLERMLNAVRFLPVEGYGLTRHFLLLHIVEQTYRNRDNPQMRDLCKHYSIQHIKEMPYYVKIMDIETKELDGESYRFQVPTFQHLATIYTEEKKFIMAIEVCKEAINYHIPDNTKSGYEGRIERIVKKMSKNS